MALLVIRARDQLWIVPRRNWYHSWSGLCSVCFAGHSAVLWAGVLFFVPVRSFIGLVTPGWAGLVAKQSEETVACAVGGT